MKRITPVLLLISLIATLPACAQRTSESTQKTERISNSDKKQLPDRKYYADTDGDGLFEETIFDRNPEPVQGQQSFVMDFYRAIKYPPSARENGIQGLVTLQIDINEMGRVTAIDVKKSLHPECDINAIHAFKQASGGGFKPAFMHGQAVVSRIDWHVGFWLE